MPLFLPARSPSRPASKSRPIRAQPPPALITRRGSSGITRCSSRRSVAVTAANGQPCLSTSPLIHFSIHRSLPLSISQSTYSSARSYLQFIRPVHVSRYGVLNHLSHMRNQNGQRSTLNYLAHKHKPLHKHKHKHKHKPQHKSQPQYETQDLPHPQASSALNLDNLTKKLIDVTILKPVTIVLFISLVSRKIPSQSPRTLLNSQK